MCLTHPCLLTGVMPLWLESVLQRQRSTASVDDVEMQRVDSSAADKPHPLRRGSSRARSLRRLGSDCLRGSPASDNSAEVASGDQVGPIKLPMIVCHEALGGGFTSR